MNGISKDDIKELKRKIEHEPETYTKEAKIIYDQRQYSVRIPARVAKVMNLDLNNDRILFSMHIPSKIEEKPTLEIKLIRHRA